MTFSLDAGPAETDGRRASRLLPAGGLHPAVPGLHGAVSSPAAAQPGAAAAQPEGGEEVRRHTQRFLPEGDYEESELSCAPPTGLP